MNPQASTNFACHAIGEIPQVWEEDADAILGALKTAIERSGNMHLPMWHDLCAELEALQVWMQERVEDRRIEADQRRKASEASYWRGLAR